MAETQTSVQMTNDDGYTLEIRRVIKAPRTKVFDAFIVPEIFGQWWGPKGVTCRNLRIDARVGGRYSLEMHHESGNIHHLSGTYDKIDPPNALAYSWQWGVGDDKGRVTNVALRFEEHADGTEIILLHTGFENEEFRDNHNSGWSGSFDCLDDVV